MHCVLKPVGGCQRWDHQNQGQLCLYCRGENFRQGFIFANLAHALQLLTIHSNTFLIYAMKCITRRPQLKPTVK